MRRLDVVCSGAAHGRATDSTFIMGAVVAILGTSQAFARMWGRHGVNVNSVVPGYVDTEVTTLGATMLQVCAPPPLPSHTLPTAHTLTYLPTLAHPGA